MRATACGRCRSGRSHQAAGHPHPSLDPSLRLLSVMRGQFVCLCPGIDSSALGFSQSPSGKLRNLRRCLFVLAWAQYPATR